MGVGLLSDPPGHLVWHVGGGDALLRCLGRSVAAHYRELVFGQACLAETGTVAMGLRIDV